MPTYEDWAAAGKPGGFNTPGNVAFNKILEKSTKRPKKGGPSPYEKALQSAIEGVATSNVKNEKKAFAQQTKNENKAAEQANKDQEVMAKLTQKAQQEADAARAKGVIASPSIKNAQAVVSNEDIFKNLGTDAAGVKNLNPNDPRFQEAFGKNPDLLPSVLRLKQQMNDQQAKVDAAGGGDGGGGILGFLGDVGSTAFHGAVDVAGRGIDIVSRPGYAAVAGANAAIDNIKDYAGGVVQQKTFTPHLDSSPDVNTDPGQNIADAMWGGFTGQKIVTGQQLLENLGLPDIPVVTPVGGWITETGLDPTTYFSLGIGSAVKKGLDIGVKEGIDIEKSILRQAVKAGTEKTATVATSKLAEKTAKDAVSKIAKAGGAIGTPVTKHEELANMLYENAVKAGADPGHAIAATRRGIVQEVLAEAADQKWKTLAANAAKDNKRMIDVRLLGKSTNIGKLPIIDLPYQAVRKGKTAFLNKGIGEALNKAFNTKYWFPGETHTLLTKANSLGVADFTKQYHEIRDAFRGLSHADKVRIADATEQGISLAGELGKNGIDLGIPQKFFKTKTDQMFDESMNILGKYSPKDKVDDFVFHYYRNKGPAKINEIRKIRKARLHAGATGADRLTLKEAEDLGLKPMRPADQILVAHAADHQRQMVSEAFHRMMVDNYGMVTDNAITAQKLGLVPVKIPKSAKVAKGMKIYMDPEVKRVYESMGKFMGRADEESAAILRHFDQVMRTWKMANTSMRPGHHIRNMIGDIYMNYLDGVTNPHRYWQGLQMVSGDRSKLRVKVGQRTLNGDEIYDLWRRSGANQGFISSEIMEGRNPLFRGINEFSQNREMFGRYAHFIDSLVKDGKKINLGAKNNVGLMKLATDAGKRINKWNINYSDLTPFEKTYMKRAIPFYTWSRKALPLMLEALYTRPGRVTQVNKINHLISNIAGVDATDLQDVPYPEWMKEAGFARISDGAEPNVWSVPFPTQDLGRMFNVQSPDDLAKNVLGQINPLAQLLIERGTGRSLYTGAQLPSDNAAYAAGKFGVAKNVIDLLGIGKDEASTVKAINALTGLGIYKDTEQAQLSELRRQQDPLDVQVKQINSKIAPYEIHKLKDGWSIYNSKTKSTAYSGFKSYAEALQRVLSEGKK